MNNKKFGYISHWSSVMLAVAMGLSGCGGGDSQPDSSNRTSQVPDVEQSSTVSAYTAAQASNAPAISTSSLDEQLIPSALGDITRQLAVEDMTSQLDAGNVSVAPALTLAHLNLLVAAARGDSLAHLTAAFPQDATTAGAVSTWLGQSGSVSRQLWAQRGQTFLLSFLDRASFGGMTSSANWQGGETGFADASVGNDEAVNRAFSTANSELMAYSVDHLTHLVVVDAIKPHLSWPVAEVFTGRFLDDNAFSQVLSMVRVTQGVVQYAESGFVADALTLDGVTVMTITPSAGSLKDFLTGQHLDLAIKNSVTALLDSPSSANLPQGRLVLPAASNLRIPLNVDALLRKRQVADWAYGEVIANFKGLDGVGGTYVKLQSPASHLKINAQGLTMEAASAVQFIFSERNINGSSGDSGSSSGVILTVGPRVHGITCAEPPDLRTKFLAILDSRRILISLTALNQPDGMSVTCL
jgi:hypothetical protein